MTVHLLGLQPLKALLPITMITDEEIWIMSRMVINRRKLVIIREKSAHVPLYTQDMQRLSWNQNQTSAVKAHKLVSELNGY
jgi:hypothetical protein